MLAPKCAAHISSNVMLLCAGGLPGGQHARADKRVPRREHQHPQRQDRRDLRPQLQHQRPRRRPHVRSDLVKPVLACTLPRCLDSHVNSWAPPCSVNLLLLRCICYVVLFVCTSSANFVVSDHAAARKIYSHDHKRLHMLALACCIAPACIPCAKAQWLRVWQERPGHGPEPHASVQR